MAALADDLMRQLEPPVSADPEQLMRDLVKPLSKDREREVQVVFEHFPPNTASGLWLRYQDQDLIVVEKNTTALHKAVILGHEIWHLNVGACKGHPAHGGIEAAARSFDGTLDLASTVRMVMAARTDFALEEEKDAESFGLRLGSRLRPYLEGGPDQMPVGGVISRLQASLGRPTI